MKINAGVNAKDLFKKVYAKKDLFGFLVILSAKIVSAKKRFSKQISWRMFWKYHCNKTCWNKFDRVQLRLNQMKHNSCTLYIVLFSIIFTINVGIGIYFLCFYWHFKKDVICVNNLKNL